MWEEVAPKVMLREGFFGLNMAKRLMMSSVSQLCVTCTLCGPSSSSLGTLPPGSSQRNGMSLSGSVCQGRLLGQGCPHLTASCVQALVCAVEEVWELQAATAGIGVWRSWKRKDSLEMSGPSKGPPSVSHHCV